MTTLAQALATTDEDTIFACLMTDMGANDVNAVGFGPYSVNLALPKLNAKALATWQNFRAALAQSNFLDTAANADFQYLVRLAQGFFALTWIQATQAAWTMTIGGTTSGGPYVVAPRDLVVSTQNGVTFTNTTGGTLAAGPGQTLVLSFTADVAGIGGNITPGLLYGFTKGGIPGATITATSLTTAARNDETAAELIARCKGRWGTLGAGWTLTAIDYLIPQAAPTVTRWVVADWNPGPWAGSVGVSIADAAGPASSDEIAAVLAGLSASKPGGSGVLTVSAASDHVLTLAGTLLTDGTNPNAAALATTAMQYLASNFPLGPRTLTADLVIAILMGGAFPVLGIPGFNGVTGLTGFTLADTMLTFGQVLTVSPTIVQV